MYLLEANEEHASAESLSVFKNVHVKIRANGNFRYIAVHSSAIILSKETLTKKHIYLL